MKQKQKKGNGTEEVMQYSCMGEQKKGNRYEIEVEEGKWNRRSYVVILYGGIEEGKQLRNRSRRREMEQVKLCSTLVWGNRRRETVMKQKQKKGNETDEVMQYSCMEEQKKGNSYKIEVEEGKWNR